MKPIHFASLLFSVFSLIFLIFPIAYLFGVAINDFRFELISSDIFFRVIGFTYFQALISSVVSGFVGVFLTLFCSETNFVGKKIITRFCEVTFFLPTLVVVLAIIGVWGHNGWLGGLLPNHGLYGGFGILLAHVFFNFSVYFKIVGQSFSEMDRNEEKISLSLGASRWKTFWKVTFVKLRPSIFQSFLLVFLCCASSFVVLLILGGGPRFSGLETAIYQATKVDLNIPLAVSLALIQLLAGFFIHLFYRPNQRPVIAGQSRYQTQIYWCRRSLGRQCLIVLVVGIVGVLVFLPLLNLLTSGLKGFIKLPIEELASTLATSLALGLKVSFLSTLIALSAAYMVQHSSVFWVKKAVSFISMLPVAVSTMVLGLAITVTFPFASDWIQEKMWGIVCIQSLTILPLSFRILSESFSKIEKEIYFSSQSLGANALQQLVWIELPLVKRSIGLAAATGLGVSLGEVGAVLLFESQGRLTLPLWMFKLMGKYQFDEAQALGFILLLMMVVIFMVKEKWESSL